MKKLLVVMFLAGLASSAHAGANQMIELLPMSNETASSVSRSTGVTGAAVTVTTYTCTALDSTVNAALLTAFGASYNRAVAWVQLTASTPVVVGFEAVDTGKLYAGGMVLVKDAAPFKFELGKDIHIYGIAGPGAASSVRVSALGWK